MPPTPAPTEISIAERARRDLADLQASKPPAPTGVAALDPDVRAAVERQPWGKGPLDPEHKVLVDFLNDASQNLLGIRPEWPFISRVVDGRLKDTPFDSESEIKIVDQNLYDFIPLQRGPELVVFSSVDVDLKRQDVEPVIASVRKWLPQVEKFVGQPIRAPYLHVQVAGLGQSDDTSFTNGANIAFSENASSSPDFQFLVVHELTHLYVRRLPSDARPWLREGIADLVAGALTGARVSGYTQVASHEPLPVDINPSLQPGFLSRSYVEESGNGSLFLFAVLDAIGPENMSKAVAAIHNDSATSTRHGNDLFDFIRQNTPPDKKDDVEAIIKKWTTRPPPSAASTPAAASAR